VLFCRNIDTFEQGYADSLGLEHFGLDLGLGLANTGLGLATASLDYKTGY